MRYRDEEGETKETSSEVIPKLDGTVVVEKPIPVFVRYIIV